MDAFSWYRQRRQTPPGRPILPTTDIRIPLIPHPTVGLMVYCRFASESEIPSEGEAEDAVWEWLQEFAEDSLREGVIRFFERGLLGMELHERDSIPPPPDALLRAFNPGEVEERRFREATHVVLIEANDLLLPPRVGLWAALATAHALTATFPGAVTLDPEFPRLLPLSLATLPLPVEGSIRVVDHILIPYSQDPRTGLLWMTTKGMARFGLPDLELRDVPPNLASSLMPVLNGLAQRLLEAAMHHVQEVGPVAGFERAAVLPMKAELLLHREDVSRAYTYSDEEAEAATPEEGREGEESLASLTGVAGVSPVRLAVEGGTRRQPPTLRLMPPAETGTGPEPRDPRDFGIWLNILLTDLFGSDPELAMVETGDAAMEQAHQRALAELPWIRSRFQAGFQSGEVLHIKHGFSTAGDSHEFMWIAVTGWRDGRIWGRLANDPQYRRDLRAGQSIEIPEEQVYDWLIVHTDGRVEGAYTNRLLEDTEE